MRGFFDRYSVLGVMALLVLTACGSDDDGNKAKVRLLNVSAGYESLDLFAKGPDDDSDQRRIQAVAQDTLSDYASLKPGDYTIKFKKHDVSSTLQTLSGRDLDEKLHVTYVAAGSSGNFAVQEIKENVAAPGNGQAKLQVVNTAEAGDLDVYLTESSVALEDASPAFSDVASGSVSNVSTLDSGEYRLRVTGVGDTDDLRLDVASVRLDSKSVASLIVSATAGGVLVHAALLPQKGSLTKHSNNKARVRGAVAIANGSATTRIAGVSVLNAAGAGVLGNYAQVDAGSAAVSLSVDGSAVTVSNQTLRGGGDYTFLVWSNGSGTQATLISDDNRLPATSGRAKLRIVNGLSALQVPATLAVDYSPIAEAIALGQASGYTELDEGSDYQLDITNSSTSASLLSRSSVSLQAAGTYTMFTFNTGGSTVNGTLRKDR